MRIDDDAKNNPSPRPRCIVVGDILLLMTRVGVCGASGTYSSNRGTENGL